MDTHAVLKALFSFTFQSVIVLFLLEFCRIIGTLFLRDKAKTSPSIYFCFGFCLLVIAEIYISRFAPVLISYLYLVSIMVLIVIIKNYIKIIRVTQSNITNTKKSSLRVKLLKTASQFQHIWYGLPGLISSSIYYLWVTISSSTSKPYLNSFTLGNNDLGVYLIDSTNIAKTGYLNSGDIISLDPTHWIATDHPAAKSFLAVTPALFNLKNWQFGNIGMIFLVTLLSTGLMTLAKDVLKIRNGTSSLITLASLTSPYIFYTVGNFFLAQVMCLPLLLLGINSVLLKMRIRKRILIQSITFAALLITSSELSIVLFLLTLSIQILNKILKMARRDKQVKSDYLNVLEDLHITLDSFILGCIAVLPWAFSAINQFSISAKNGIGGWPLFVWNPLTWFGVSPIGAKNSIISVLCLFFIIFLKFLFKSNLRNSRNSLAYGLLGIVFSLMILGVLKWGTSGYQTWKLFTTLQPLLVVLILSTIIPRKMKRRFFNNLTVVLMIFLSALQIFSGIQQSKKIFPHKDFNHHVISTDFRLLLSSEIAKRQVSLDILVQPYFETMASSSIAQVPVNFVSPTYYSGGEFWPFRSTCTVTKKEFLDRLNKNPQIRAQVGDYLLVDNPRCV